MKFGQKWRNSISFSKLKKVAAAMLDSGNQLFFDAIDELYQKLQHSHLIY